MNKISLCEYIAFAYYVFTISNRKSILIKKRYIFCKIKEKEIYCTLVYNYLIISVNVQPFKKLLNAVVPQSKDN